MSSLAWPRLLRLSLAPSLIADVAAGAAVVQGSPIRSCAVLPASLALFTGGMALNAYLDRDEDGRTRPDRPLPSGEIAPGAALWFAIVALLGAPFLAAFAGSRATWVAAALAVVIVAYHSPLRRVGVVGPVLLGTIRGGHLCFGAAASGSTSITAATLGIPAACYFLYVCGASLVAREEDRTTPRVPWVRAGLVLALLALGIVVAIAWWRARDVDALRHCGAALLVALFLLRPLWRRLDGATPFESSPGAIAALAGTLLGRMTLFTAVLALGAGGTLAAVLALAAFVLVRWSMRWIPPS